MSILLFPFRLIWGLTTFILGLVGSLLTIIIGLALMVVGVILTLTIIGAPAGIPMILFGFVLVLRGIF